MIKRFLNKTVTYLINKYSAANIEIYWELQVDNSYSMSIVFDTAKSSLSIDNIASDLATNALPSIFTSSKISCCKLSYSTADQMTKLSK